MKAILSILGMLFLGAAPAQWTATSLSIGAGESRLRSATGAVQAGVASIGGKNHGGIWSATAASFVDLNPAGANQSYCLGSASGLQVGYMDNGSTVHAGYWSGSAGSFVDLHPNQALSSEAEGISGGTQVGWMLNGSAETHALIWSGTATSAVDLNPIGASESYAHCTTGSFQYGEARFTGVTNAAKWSSTPQSYVSLMPSTATSSRIYGCSATQQVGSATVSGKTHAILWSGTAASFVDLHPAGANSSVARGVYGTTQAGSYNSGSDHACVWNGTAASMVDLHSFLPANYSSSAAYGVSSDGLKEYVVGQARNTTTGHDEAILWSRNVATFAFTLNKSTVAGQNSVQGTITLPSAATDPTVFTTYDNSSLVTTPPSVTIAAHTTVKNFQITVTAVTSPINTIVYAKLGSTILSQPLTLAPLVPTALSFTPSPVAGGQSTVGKVVINGVAGPGGRTIALIDNSSYATTPSSVVVPAGASSVTFTITTKTVPAIQTVTITARVTAGEKTGTFRINP